MRISFQKVKCYKMFKFEYFFFNYQQMAVNERAETCEEGVSSGNSVGGANSVGWRGMGE